MLLSLRSKFGNTLSKLLALSNTCTVNVLCIEISSLRTFSLTMTVILKLEISAWVGSWALRLSKPSVASALLYTWVLRSYRARDTIGSLMYGVWVASPTSFAPWGVLSGQVIRRTWIFMSCFSASQKEIFRLWLRNTAMSWDNLWTVCCMLTRMI